MMAFSVIPARDLASCNDRDVAQLTRVFEAVCAPEHGVGLAGSVYYLRTRIEIGDFVDRLCKYLYCSVETLLAASLLMQRWAEKSGENVNRDNFFRLLFAAVLAAIKSREDEFFNNAYYAKIWGLDVAMANDLESDFLGALGWELFIDTDDFAEVARACEFGGRSP